MTKINGLILEAQILNAISNVDTIISVESFIQNKNERVFYLLEALRDEAVKNSLGITKQV